MDNRAEKPYRVLVVDDSEDDRFFLRTAIREHPRMVIVGEVCNGEDAIAYLSGQSVFADRELFPMPDAMFLDLKMPRIDGFEVLEWLRGHPFDPLLVMVLSSSNLPEDIQKARELGAHAYQTKTSDRTGQAAMIREFVALLDRRKKTPNAGMQT